MTDLAAEAASVLDGNWIGRSTKPSAGLYPHQWSWDSAFIAIGNARRGRPDMATLELRTLFDAQWTTGMVPHMVFDEDATGYFPSVDLWGTRTVAARPAHALTSGMCQPPVHALAVREVAAALDHEDRRRFLADMYEPLEAWHDYLHRTRAVDSPLLEIWHPWESGMDNSPLWDAALARLDPAPDDIPPYRRVDTDHRAAAERPTREHYDRYVYLLEQLRRQSYQPADPTSLQFRVCDVLFNTVAADADTQLGAIAHELGVSQETELRDRAEALTRAIETEMWSEDDGLFVDLDRAGGESIPVPTAAGCTPLLLGVDAARRRRLVTTLRDTLSVRMPGSRAPDGSARLVPTVPVTHAAFDADRYWRGPVWVNITWLLIRGLRASGADELAGDLRDGCLSLVTEGGCSEYYNPLTGEPLGAGRFSWTAALVLDLLAD